MARPKVRRQSTAICLNSLPRVRGRVGVGALLLPRVRGRVGVEAFRA